MKAAVCYEFGKPLIVEELDMDPPKKGEVKVRIAATAVYHSDIHIIRGELKANLPLVAGHETPFLQIAMNNDELNQRYAKSSQPLVFHLQRKIKELLDPNDIGDRLYTTLPESNK